jgi:hypothetical protein
MAAFDIQPGFCYHHIQWFTIISLFLAAAGSQAAHSGTSLHKATHKKNSSWIRLKNLPECCNVRPGKPLSESKSMAEEAWGGAWLAARHCAGKAVRESLAAEEKWYTYLCCFPKRMAVISIWIIT